MEHVDKMWPSWSTADKVEMARKVYFALLNLEEIMANMASNAVSLSVLTDRHRPPSLVEFANGDFHFRMFLT